MAGSAERQILEALPDTVFVVDGRGVILDFRPSPVAEPSLPPAELLGRPLGDLLPREVSDPALEVIGRVLDDGRPRVFEYVLEEGLREFECRFTPLDGNEVLGVVRDVTREKSAARRLTRNEETLRALFNAAPDLTILLDHDGTILAINDRAAGLYNRSVGEMVGRLYWDFLAPQVADMRKARLRTIVRNQQPAHFLEITDDRTFEISVHPVVDDDGPTDAVALFIRDVTERMRAENELIESEARHRRLFEQNPLPMYVYDMDTLRILEVNAAMVNNYGYSREEFLAMTMEQIRPPGDRERIQENVRDLRGGQTYHGLWRHLKADGTVIDVDITSTDFPVQGRLARLVLCEDVTEQLEVQRRLTESEARFRTAFRTSPDALAIVRISDGVYEEVNEAFSELTGYRPDEVAGRTSQDFEVWADPAERERFYEDLKRDGMVDQREVILSFREGRRITGLLSANVIQLGGVPHMILTVRDITPLKEAEKAIRDSEAKFRTAFLTSPDSININRLEDGIYIDVNEGFLRITGYSREEVVGRTSRELGIWADPADRDRLVDGLRRRGEVDNLEAMFRMKNGKLRHGLMSARVLNLDGTPHILSITRDITEWTKAQEQIRASLREKEVLLQEVHHRVKNNLQVISGLLNLQAHHITDDVGRQIYKESQNRVITMALIHEELYQARDLAHVDFAEYIRNLTENLFGSYSVDPDRIGLKLDTEAVNMVVDTAIPCGLIVNELVSNALKHAFPDGRKGMVRVRFAQTGEKDFRLEIADDGVGLPAMVDIKKSRSLGMQLVTVLSEQLGAELVIETGPGTTFTLLFSEYMEAGTEMF